MITPPAVLRPVVLARHGETDDNAAARFQGRRNPPLNARGREQAAALGLRLAAAASGDLLADAAVRRGHAGVQGPVPAIREIWASPYARARETAELVAAQLALPITFDERLKESDVGDWSGQTYAEVQAADPVAFQQWVDGDPAHRFPGGESLAEVSARVQGAIDDARVRDATVLCVCHGGVIRTALRASGFELVGSVFALNGEGIAA